MFKKIILTIIALTIVLATVQLAHGYAIPSEYKPVNAPLGSLNYAGGDSADLTNTVLQIIAGTLLYFAAPIAVFSIAQAAFTLTIGGADTEKLEQGKKHLTWAIVGLIAIVFSFSIVKIAITFMVQTGNYAANTVQEAPAAEAPAAESTSTPPSTPSSSSSPSTGGSSGGMVPKGTSIQAL